MKPWWRRGLPGWWSFGGGGGGLSSVTTNSTLTGNGTGGSPLGVAGMPIIFYSSGNGLSSESLAAANDIDASGFVLQYPITFAHLAFQVNTADGVNSYDVGIYTNAGALVANIGPQHLPSTGLVSFITLQGSQTILPGLYAFAWTSAATTAQLGIDNNLSFTWFQSHSIGTSSGSTLPASVSPIAISVTGYGLALALF